MWFARDHHELGKGEGGSAAADALVEIVFWIVVVPLSQEIRDRYIGNVSVIECFGLAWVELELNCSWV